MYAMLALLLVMMSAFLPITSSSAAETEDTAVVIQSEGVMRLDDDRFSALLSGGSGVVLITGSVEETDSGYALSADDDDGWARLLAPVIYDVVRRNNGVLQLYAASDAGAAQGLMQSVLDQDVSVTGSKSLVKQWAESGDLPRGCALFVKDGKLAGVHAGTLKRYDACPESLTDEDIAAMEDMLQFQLDKLLSGGCDIGC